MDVNQICTTQALVNIFNGIVHIRLVSALGVRRSLFVTTSKTHHFSFRVPRVAVRSVKLGDLFSVPVQHSGFSHPGGGGHLVEHLQ